GGEAAERRDRGRPGLRRLGDDDVEIDERRLRRGGAGDGERADQAARRRVPELDRLVPTRRREAEPVRGEGDARNFAGVAAEFVLDLAGDGVPEFDEPVAAG